jgi:radical SAM protein with 4Fe4S-binding SPASM domain
MLNINQLLRPEAGVSNAPRPTPASETRYTQQRERYRPVVVWNTTYTCNMRCVHCYTSSGDEPYPGELTTAEGLALLDDLADTGVPALILSGGEPLRRDDWEQLTAAADARGLYPCLSSNGLLIDADTADRLAAAGCRYVGVSIDGLEEANDRMRATPGGFRRALDGLRAARDAGLPTGLRLTLTRLNHQDLPGLIELARAEGVDRLYVSHLQAAGRGAGLSKVQLAADETRRALIRLFDAARHHEARGGPEIVTGGHEADGPFLVHYLRARHPGLADLVHERLARRGGNTTGTRVANIGNTGDVHPDQFWTAHPVGNIRERPFDAIWNTDPDPLLRDLRRRGELLSGRCGACAHLELCNGSSRTRAEAYYGDPFAPDPACYLSDAEVGLAPVEAAP